MSEWKNKSDRAHAHALLRKAGEAEFAAVKIRLAQQALAMENTDDIFALSKEAKEGCRDFGFWYTSTFSDMTMKIMRHHHHGYLNDDDLAAFSAPQRTEFAEWIKRREQT